MGYQTYFGGEIDIDPPLGAQEIAYLREQVLDDCTLHLSDDGSALQPDEDEMGSYRAMGLAGDIAALIEAHLGSQAKETEDAAELAEKGFTFDHVLSGTLWARGEERDDLWAIEVRDNEVRVLQTVVTVTYDSSEQGHAARPGEQLW